MTQNNNDLFKIHVDDKLFIMTRRTIESNPESLLARAIRENEKYDYLGEEYKYVVVDGFDVYVDRNPESFVYVINKLRNYEIDLDSVTDIILKKQIIDDLDYFDLYCNYDVESCDITFCTDTTSECNTDEVNTLKTDPISSLNDMSPDNVNLDMMQTISNDQELSKLIKEQNIKKKCESSSDSLEFSEEDMDGYELV